MPAFIDITGQRFGRLVVIQRYDRLNKMLRWLCACDCGNQTIAHGSALTSGHTKSCGCLKRDGHIIHGGARRKTGLTPEYRTWQEMWRRCTDPNRWNYKYYGGRGITVCERWKSFENFLADMGPKPKGYSIERIDHNGNYEPSNCKWIPLKEQQKNRRPEAYGHAWKYRKITRDSAGHPCQRIPLVR